MKIQITLFHSNKLLVKELWKLIDLLCSRYNGELHSHNTILQKEFVFQDVLDRSDFIVRVEDLFEEDIKTNLLQFTLQ